MPVYHLLKIRHTAVGHFDGIPVEYFPEGVILGKGSFHYFKEISSHSGFAIEGPGWVNTLLIAIPPPIPLCFSRLCQQM